MKETQKVEKRPTLLIFLFLSFIFLFPLLNFVPQPSSNPSHPWFAELFALVGVTCFLLFWVKTNRLLELSKLSSTFLYLFCPFLLWSCLSLLWSESKFSVLHFLAVWFIYLITFLIFCLLINARNSASLIFTFGMIALIVGFCSFFELVTSETISNKTYVGVYRIRYGKYAEILATLAPFLLCLSLQTKKRASLLFTLAAGMFSFLGVLSSLSRGAALAVTGGFIIAFFGIFLFSFKSYRRFLLILVLLLLVFGFLSQNSAFIPLSTIEYARSGENFGSSYSTNMRKLFWKVAFQMIKQKPITGVGADNFWLEFNNAKREFALQNPNDETLGLADDYFVQRAHNEVLQITAELGIVGLLLFSIPFLWLMREFYLTLRKKGKLPPAIWGAVGGAMAFFISSLVSSFSFRFLASGITFFLIMAFLTNQLARIRRRLEKSENLATNNSYDVVPLKSTLRDYHSQTMLSRRFGFYLLPPSFGLMIICLMANIGNFLIVAGEQKQSASEAEGFLKTAPLLNPTNPTAYFSLGLRYYNEKDFSQAREMFEKAIAEGFDVSISRFYLASSYRAVGNLEKEEEVLREALTIFPKSIFLRVKLFKNLSMQGKHDEAEKELEIAMNENREQAIGWERLMTLGASRAGREAMNNRSFLPPTELQPAEAVYLVVHEQEVLLLFPR